MDEFFYAAEKGDLEKIKAFIQENIDVNITGNYGFTALILAAINGRLDVVKVLIANKSDINKAVNNGYTALMWAAINGHLNVVEELISNKVDVNKVSEEGNTALMLAIMKGHLNITKELISNKANINTANKYGETALIWAGKYGHLDIVKELIKKNADVNIADYDGYTALMWAAQKNYLEVVKELIEKNADVNIKDNYGDTALIEAARKEHLDIVKELLNSGSDLLLVNTKENSETLVLHKLLSYANAKASFDKLPQGNFEGLNSLGKLQLLRAFNFIQNNYDKFKDFYSEEHIRKLKASLEICEPLESLISELTDTNVLDFSTAESRHKLESSINQLKCILENKNKYESEGIEVNQAKIKEFQNKCKTSAGKKYHELIQNLGNIGLKDIFKEYFKLENIELPDSICAQICLKLLISNRDTQENISSNEDMVTGTLPCATDTQYETYLLTSNIAELGSMFHTLD